MKLAEYDEEEALNTLPNQKTSAPVSGKFGQILVVDDEVELKNALVEMLNAQGYNALGCTSGRDAMEALRQQNFDVLLSDLMMPEMDGVALLRAALEIDQNLVCIIMTGQGTIQTAVDAMKVGAFDYVLKPFRLQALLPVLARAVNMRLLRQENLQLRETVAIYELCQTIAFTLDRQTLLSKFADSALQQSEADEVSLLLLNADGSELYVAAVRGENRTRLLGERVPLEQGISSWVARERTPLLLEGQVNDARFTAMWPRADIRSAISVPLQVAGKLVGIINVNNVSSPRPFTLGQMKALTILASTAAAALESTSLYERVRQAEQNYRSIFENAVEGIFQSTPDGRFITVNPSTARILGYDSPGEVIETITDITHQLYVDPECRAEAAQIQEEHDVIQGFEFEAYRKDGEKIWLSLNRRSVRDENGVELYREGSLEDVTERKRAEEALRASEAELRALFAAMTDVILVLDAEGRYQKIAPTDPAYLYKPPADLLGKRLDEVFPKEEVDFFLTHIRRALDEGRMHRVEYRLQMSGTEVWFDGSVSPVSKDSVIWIARDITERKRAEEEKAQLTAQIESQRQRLNNIVDSVPGVVWEAWGEPNSATQRMNFVSNYVETMLGYSVEEWLQTPNFWLSIVHPDDREQTGRTSAEDFARGKSSGPHEFRWVTKDGRAIWVESNCFVVKNDEAQSVGLRGVNTDISERKRMEDDLRKQKEILQKIFDHLPVMISFFDAAGRIKLVNQEWERTRGWTLAEIQEQNLDVLTEGYPDTQERQRARDFITNSTGEWADFKTRTRDGRAIDTTWAVVPLPDATRVAIGQNITERKLAEEALRESEKRYRLLFARNPQPMWVFDSETLAFLEVNDAAIHHYGYAREEFLAMTIKDIRPAEDVPKLLANVSEATPLHEEAGIWKHRTKDGTIIDVEINAHELTFYGRPAQMVLAYDVTERRLLEEQLRQSQKMEAVGQLAGGIAHDFNNLLTVITGYSDLTLRRLDKESPFRSSLEEIKKAGERAASLTRQLLAFSRKQVLQPKVLQLNAIVADVDKMLRRLIGEDIDPLTLLEPSLGQIKADPGQIEQVILNLAVNARDAMPQGGKLTIETDNVYLDNQYARRHTAIQPGQYVMLAVSDTGCGIDAETQMRIFEPFFTTKEQGKGTGLGLSTVYGIVKQSGGHLWVYSEVGKGTTFKIYLPRVDGVNERDEARDTMAKLPQGRETVLLTEDEEQVRQMIQMILEMNGYHVLAASGGEEALALYKQHEGQIDLIITDVVMPQMSGRELAQSLEVLHPGIKVLYMSGYTDDAIVRHGLLDQEIAFLQKPFTPDALMRKVREVLDAPRVG
jgi:two-component system, cell cycle sensor histidine kinase and response regulator CckA